MKTIYTLIIAFFAIISLSSCDKNVAINSSPHTFEFAIKTVDANGVNILPPDTPWWEPLTSSAITEAIGIFGESTVDYTSISEITLYSKYSEDILLRLATMSSDFESMPNTITYKFYSEEVFGNRDIHTAVTTWSYPTEAPYNSPIFKTLVGVTIDGVNHEIIKIDGLLPYVKLTVN